MRLLPTWTTLSLLLCPALACAGTLHPLTTGDCNHACQWQHVVIEYLDPDEDGETNPGRDAAFAALEEMTEASGFPPIAPAARGRLPSGAWLAWELLSGRVDPRQLPSALFANLPEREQDIVVGLYVRAQPDRELAQALAPYLRMIQRREFLSWMAMAGIPAARSELLSGIGRCQFEAGECPELPDTTFLGVEELERLWPQVDPALRPALLASTGGSRLPGFIATHLSEAQPAELVPFWQAMRTASEARSTVAALLMYRLAVDPAGTGDSSQSATDGEPPMQSGWIQVEAWHALVADPGAGRSELWDALASHDDPAISAFGIAGHIATTDKGTRRHAGASTDDQRVLELLSGVQSDRVDAYLLERTMGAATLLDACKVIPHIEGDRRERLVGRLAPWVAGKLASLPPASVPALEQLPGEPGEARRTVSGRSPLCLLDAIPDSIRKQREGVDSLAFAKALSGSRADIVRVVGAMLLADLGDPAVARALFDEIRARAPFPAQGLILAMLERTWIGQVP